MLKIGREIIYLPVLIGFDQLVKLVVLRKLPMIVVFNNAGAFGLGRDLAFYDAMVGAVIVLLLFYFAKAPRKLRLPLVLIVSGAISNHIDRLFRGGAVDFINLKIWPSFNFADILICVGLALVIYEIFFHPKTDP